MFGLITLHSNTNVRLTVLKDGFINLSQIVHIVFSVQ